MKKTQRSRKCTGFIDQIRYELLNCGVSRYRVSKETGIDQAVLTGFVKGYRGMTLPVLDRLTGYLGLDVVARAKPPSRESIPVKRAKSQRTTTGAVRRVKPTGKKRKTKR